MIESNIKIINKLGLHARAASLFVKIAEKYKCQVKMKRNGITVNAKSIMGILMLAAPFESTITIITSGEQELECIEALKELVEKKFGEDE